MAVTAPNSYVNVLTGEVLDFVTMSDEEIVVALRDLQSALDATRSAVRVAQAELMERMARDGATLRMTDIATLRLHHESKPVGKKAVQELYQRCPDEFKERCFAFDIRPLKTGLNELAKLGHEWRELVDKVYETTPKLKVEWKEEPS